MATLLTMSGADVRTAFLIATGLKAAVKHLPDVVLLDIGLPRLNGCRVARHVCVRIRDSRTCGVEALTGYGDEADRRK